MTGILTTIKLLFSKLKMQSKDSYPKLADLESTLGQWYIESLKNEIEFLRSEIIRGYDERRRLHDYLERATTPINEQINSTIPTSVNSIIEGAELPSEKRRRLTMEAYEKMRAAKRQKEEDDDDTADTDQ